jgi:hypothetical protein
MSLFKFEDPTPCCSKAPKPKYRVKQISEHRFVIDERHFLIGWITQTSAQGKILYSTAEDAINSLNRQLKQEAIPEFKPKIIYEI